MILAKWSINDEKSAEIGKKNAFSGCLILFFTLEHIGHFLNFRYLSIKLYFFYFPIGISFFQFKIFIKDP